MYADEGGSAGSSLEIEEDLSCVERVKRYCQSSVNVQRLVHVQELGACAESIGTLETMRQLVPLLMPISCDPELSVRQALAEQLTRFAKVLLADPDVVCEYEDGDMTAYEVVISRCVPLLSGLLASNSMNDVAPQAGNMVLEAASDALIGLAGLLSPDAVGHTVLTSVLCLAHDNDADENRVVATQLLGALAPVVTSELCCQFVLPEIISLADDPVFRVRKTAAQKIGGLSAVVGEALAVSRLLPVFETLARDEIWGVRKCSVDSLASLAAALPLEVRTGKLIPLLNELYADGSRWVRIAACQAIGPFVATLPVDAITPQLLELFTQLANPSNPTAADTDIAYFCAYNLPAVAQAVTARRWPELAEAFRTLTSSIPWKVRRTLSYALHELAAILGEAYTESELVPTFEQFLKDLDEVKVGVIQSLCKFLSMLSPTTRLKYLPAIVEIRAETDNWRFRHMLAAQIADIGAIFPRSAITDTLVPLALDLCTDSVAEVRIAAIAQIGPLLALLFEDEESPMTVASTLTNLMDSIVAMATMQSCYRRSNCVHICSSLVGALHPEVVKTQLLPTLVPLATDPVPNVRLAMARLVKDELLTSPVFSELEPTQVMAEALRSDSDRDVLIAMHGPLFEPPPYRCKSPPGLPLPLATAEESDSIESGVAEAEPPAEVAVEPLVGMLLTTTEMEQLVPTSTEPSDTPALPGTPRDPPAVLSATAELAMLSLIETPSSPTEEAPQPTDPGSEDAATIFGSWLASNPAEDLPESG